MESIDLDIKPHLIETYKFALSFFNKHNLRSYACGGTMLGAVRHHGFIPWDDDIDIYMPRADYEKLISVRHELNGSGYKFISAQTDKNYYCPFAKIIKTDSTIWEYKKYPYTIGVYIDIFPLDYFDERDEGITLLQERYAQIFIDYQKALQVYNFSDYLNDLIKGKIFDVAKHLYFRLFFKTKKDAIYKQYIDANSKINSDENKENCVCLTQWIGKIFKRKWFEDCIDMPFEDIYIKVPRQYDEYLKLLYGNYMKYPPIEKRCGDHKHYYMNLSEKLSIDDINIRIKNGEYRKG